MTTQSGTPSFSWLRPLLQGLPMGSLVVATALASTLLLALPIMPGERSVSLSLGQVAPQDVLAPRSVAFVSQVLTDQARQEAVSQVLPVYDPADPNIARQQAQSLVSSLAYITAVRADAYSTPSQKVQDLLSMAVVHLDESTASQVLQLSDVDWQLVQAQCASVLEQVMRQEIRPDRLADARDSLPAYVSLSLPESEAVLVADLVHNLVVPNSLFNKASTEALQQEVASKVAPVTRSFVSGQVVISRGKVITAADLEAITALGLNSGGLDARTTLSDVLAVVLVTTLLMLYMRTLRMRPPLRFRHALLLSLFFLLFIAGAQVMIPSHTVLPFLYPAASLSLCLAALFGPGLGLFSGILIGVLSGMIAGGRLDLALYAALGSSMAVLTLGRAERPLNFFLAGLAGSLAGVAVVLMTWLTEPSADLAGILTLTAASLGNGLLSGSLAIGLLLLAGSLFDTTTNMQLLELSRPDQPLLRMILRNAPGTYQHSLQVANLAEHAGEAINANTLLLRVGALYHDAGKAAKPKYFVENQGPEGNPHDQLDPSTSARLIMQHVIDGLDLARRNHLPSRVRDLIPEHHGTLRASFQYNLALKAAGGEASQVDESLYHYPGPRPRSKEAALLMLADGVEAKFRALAPKTAGEIETLVRTLIEDRLAQHQFDDTDLTLKDLEQVRLALTETLRSSLHARLKYPEDEGAHLAPLPSDDDLD
ncbi:MAG: HDIG domain-containing metalloprotein [Anaerolineales bacterium]|jgi:putative nucleotidyltransferase with HDIG domain